MSDEGQGFKFRGKIIINVFNYFKTENPSLKRNALVDVTFKATGASASSEKNCRRGRFNRLDESDLGVI